MKILKCDACGVEVDLVEYARSVDLHPEKRYQQYSVGNSKVADVCPGCGVELAERLALASDLCATVVKRAIDNLTDAVQTELSALSAQKRPLGVIKKC